MTAIGDQTPMTNDRQPMRHLSRKSYTMRSLVLAISLVCSLPAALTAAETIRPWYSALRTQAAPVIDGVLDEACWVRAARTAPFVAIGGTPVAVTTTGMLCWDDRALYIALICGEPRMALLEPRLAAGQAADLGESIEVFIDTRERSSFVQLLLPVAGERRALEGGKDSARIRDGWSAQIRRLGDRWEVEMAVAWAVLADRPPAPDQVWGLNLNRTRALDAESPPFHCWSATAAAFAEPNRFGNLVFTPYPIWLRASLTARTAALTAELAHLVMRYPLAAEPLLPEFGRPDAVWTEFLRALPASAAADAAGNEALRAQGEKAVAACEDLLARLRLAVVETQFR